MFVSSDCLDCFRNAILVDQLYKHNLRMYFWNVSKTFTKGIYFSTRSFYDVIMYLCFILIINYIALIQITIILIMNKTHFTFIYVSVRYSLKM